MIARLREVHCDAATADAAGGGVRYDMTSGRVRVCKPSTADNYDITVLHSDHDTDNEDEPRKKISGCALGMCTSYLLDIRSVLGVCSWQK